MAMPDPDHGNTTGFDYIDGRFQFSVYGNDRNDLQIHDIQDRIEDLFHRQPLVLGSNCTHIATFSLNQSIRFYDQNIKVWTLSNTYRILAGK